MDKLMVVVHYQFSSWHLLAGMFSHVYVIYCHFVSFHLPKSVLGVLVSLGLAFATMVIQKSIKG